MRIAPPALLASLLVLSSGCTSCGDNIGQGPDAGGPLDGGVVDGPADGGEPVVCEMPAINSIGGACATDNACEVPVAGGGDAGVDGGVALAPTCLNNRFAVPWPAEGFCTAAECFVDADCGDGNVCALLPFAGTTFGACMPACCEGVDLGEACSSERICSNNLFGDDMGTSACIPGTLGAGDGDPCTDFGDCGLGSTCRDDSFQFPGGQCAVLQCSGDQDCAAGGDGRCVPVEEIGGLAICVDDCTGDSDCRTDQGYRCIDNGGAEGRYCRHPEPADFCEDAADCGTGEAADPWTCRTGGGVLNEYPGGYCTVEDCDPDDNNTCPIRSFCVGLLDEGDTFCADQCDPAAATPCNPGYTCTAVNPPGDPTNVCVPTGSVVVQPSPV